MTKVTMYLPAADRYQDASEEAYETRWKHDGWVRADDRDTAPGADDPVRVGKMEAPRGNASREAWYAYARHLQVPNLRDIEEYSRDDLREMARGMVGGGPFVDEDAPAGEGGVDGTPSGGGGAVNRPALSEPKGAWQDYVEAFDIPVEAADSEKGPTKAELIKAVEDYEADLVDAGETEAGTGVGFGG